MTEIKAILFDMDGVLVDAKDWHYEAFNKALSLFGLTINRYDHLVTYDGLPTRKKLDLLTLEHGLPKSLHDFLNLLKQKYTLEIVEEKCRPIFHHEYALSRLKMEGYHVAVCSNAVRNSVRTILEKACLMEYVDFYLSNQDVDRPKPDPEIYTTAINRLGVSPSETVIVEDNHHGIQAARAAGAYVLEVATTAEVNYANISQFIKNITPRIKVSA